MSYSGQRASDTQMDYIAIFNKMEAALLGKPKPAVERISATQMNHLAVLMAQLEGRAYASPSHLAERLPNRYHVYSHTHKR